MMLIGSSGGDDGGGGNDLLRIALDWVIVGVVAVVVIACFQ